MLFVQLNGPDTVAHIHGPDSDEAVSAYREVDRCLALIGEAVDWGTDLLLVTSDHDQETVSPSHRIDLDLLTEQQGLGTAVVHEGTAAVLSGPDASNTGWLRNVAGVDGWAPAGEDRCLVYSAPGWWFSDPDFPDFRGAHGGPRTRSTVAVAAGSPTVVGAIQEQFMAPRLGAEDWSALVRVALGD
jgi:hypothetical protein